MANNKDFIVKNAIEINGPSKIGIGTTSTGTINSKLENADYDDTVLDVSSQSILPTDVFFKPDGTKMFTVGIVGSTYTVNEYSLSTAYDLSTASFTQSFSTASQETAPRSIWFKTDGTKMFVLGASGDDVNEYTLSTAWSLTSVSFVDSFSVSGQDTAPYGLTFSADGTQMYICGTVEDDVIQYTLSTAWDVSEASYTRNLVITSVEPNPRDVQFNSDGTEMFISGRTNGLHKYILTTAYDISTATFDVTNSITSDFQTEPAGFFIKSDGSKAWVGDSTNKKVYQYSLVLDTVTLDLSTGNYFTDTVTNPRNYIFSNAGSAQTFQLEIDGGSKSSFIDGMAYASKFKHVASQEANPSGIHFKPDGTKMFVCGTSGDDVNEYDLSTAYDVSTATFNSNTYAMSNGSTDPKGIFFKPDGTKLFILTSNNVVYQNSLSTAWDISTASIASGLINTSSQDSTQDALWFKPDGTKMYVAGAANDSIYQYSLSTAWDLSTASYESKSFQFTQFTNPTGIAFSSNGRTLIAAGDTSNVVYQHKLETAFDVSTASNTSFNFSTQQICTVLKDLTLANDDLNLYLVAANDVVNSGTTNDSIYQFDMGASGYVIDWPTTLKWEGGLAPSISGASKKDIYTIVTNNTGTTYTGSKSANELS